MDAARALETCVAGVAKRPQLRMGSKGAAVHEWQTLMQRQMQAAIMADGVFGDDTRAATMAFQRKVRLPSDGVVGERTWRAAAVAPCYALVLAKVQGTAAGQRASAKAQQQLQQRAAHGFGDLGFSVIDMKSVVLGAVLGVGVGAVLFRRK
jgi:peptidoglycan hydrolase-like protein with peptidoglycan-binding domain